MYIIFLRFGPNRGQASQWMADHLQWIQHGIHDGVFLMAGSLDDAQGGVVLAMNLERTELQQRVELDPFVMRGVVTAEVVAVAPSRVAPCMAALLEKSTAPSAAS